MESNNPAFRKSTFAFVGERTNTMTMSGAINKAGFLFILLMVGATIGWNMENMAIGLICAVGGMITAFVTIFKQHLAPITSPIYAILDGIFLGTISAVYEVSHPGLPANAMTLTFGILGLMLLCYRMGLLRATPMFTKAIVFSTCGIALVYLVNFVMSLMGHPMAMIHEGGTVGIIFSLIVTGVASMNLILDFDLFEKQTAAGAPKYMEWYCGFALLVTLVWIYIEMLRLLSKLSRR